MINLELNYTMKLKLCAELEFIRSNLHYIKMSRTSPGFGGLYSSGSGTYRYCIMKQISTWNTFMLPSQRTTQLLSNEDSIGP